MGVISILLGIIAFICFTGAGAVLGNVYISSFKTLARTFVSMQSTVSDTTVMIAFIGVFGFIGLLFCITIVGIPFGVKHFSLVLSSIFPFGKEIQ